MRRVDLFVAAIILMTASLAPAAEATSVPATLPAESGPKIPDPVLKEMLEMFAVRPSGEMSAGEMVERNAVQMQKVIALGEKITKDYPDASNLRQVRDYMLKAARLIATTKGDSGPMEEIAFHILASGAPLEEKVQVDSLLTSFRINPTAPRSRTLALATSRPTIDAAKEIRRLVDRYAATKGDALAALEGFALAQRARKAALAAELLQELKAKYLDRPTIRTALREMCQHPDIGMTFQADLVAMDETRISMPRDYAGKVVVVCFSAPTSSTYTALLDRLGQLYADYKDKDVEIVSIYEASRRNDVTELLKTRSLPWGHALAISRETSPFAKYEILHVPTVWVLDRQGKIVSDSALSRDEPDPDGRLLSMPDPSKLKADVEKALNLQAGTAASGPAK